MRSAHPRSKRAAPCGTALSCMLSKPRPVPCTPFALSLSKGAYPREDRRGACFDKLSTNGFRASLGWAPAFAGARRGAIGVHPQSKRAARYGTALSVCSASRSLVSPLYSVRPELVEGRLSAGGSAGERASTSSARTGSGGSPSCAPALAGTRRGAIRVHPQSKRAAPRGTALSCLLSKQKRLT